MRFVPVCDVLLVVLVDLCTADMVYLKSPFPSTRTSHTRLRMTLPAKFLCGLPRPSLMKGCIARSPAARNPGFVLTHPFHLATALLMRIIATVIGVEGTWPQLETASTHRRLWMTPFTSPILCLRIWPTITGTMCANWQELGCVSSLVPRLCI